MPAPVTFEMSAGFSHHRLPIRLIPDHPAAISMRFPVFVGDSQGALSSLVRRQIPLGHMVNDLGIGKNTARPVDIYLYQSELRLDFS